MDAMRIRIISTPPGEAPEHIRQAWIGLELPLPPWANAPRDVLVTGVLSSPKSFLGKLLVIFTGRTKIQRGYNVETRIALLIPQSQRPVAANWWRENTPGFFGPGRFFLFSSECCE